MHQKILIWLLKAFLTEIFFGHINCDSRILGEPCYIDSDCNRVLENLICKKIEGDSARACLCKNGYIWVEKEAFCISEEDYSKTKEAEKRSENVAKVITILAPVLGALFVVIALSLMCCYWVNGMSKSLKTEIDKENKKDLEMNHNIIIDSEDTSSSEEDEEENRQEETKLNGKATPVPNGKPYKQETVNETPHAIGREDQISELTQNGYQASMKRLLTMPEMHSEPAMSKNRPMSAHYISNSRPGSANPYHRPLSSYLTPKESLASVGGRPLSARLTGFTSPYVSDASVLKGRRSVSPNPAAATTILSHKISAESQRSDLTELYDRITEIANEEERKKKLDRSRENSIGIEEIKLVSSAVKAFKRRRNMKKAREESFKKRKRKKKLESLVDQIIQKRREEESRPPKPHPHSTGSRNLTSRNSRRSSKSSENSGSSKQVGVSAGLRKRPESVAQRVLRERQEKKIQAKAPVTTIAKPSRSRSGSLMNGSAKNGSANHSQQQQQQQQPLHLALRQSASRHSSRALMTEKIKQQVHLNAVMNYQAPSMEVILEKERKLEAKKPKSILKKSGGQKKASVGKVNYAFDQNNEVNSMITSNGTHYNSRQNVKVDIHRY